MQHEAKQKLNELLQATGHALHVDDIDDVLELDRLAGKVADPTTGVDSPLKGHAVFFRNRPVYPLTLAHLEFRDFAMASGECRAKDMDTLILWSLTRPFVEDSDYHIKRSVKAARKWARTCPWHDSDIDAIVKLRYGSMMQDSGDTGTDGKDGCAGALVGMLSKEYGNSPDYWMYTAPIEVVKSCVADWTARQESQAAAYRKSAGGKGPAVAPAPSPKFVAMRKFRECAERIEAKWLARKA